MKAFLGFCIYALTIGIVIACVAFFWVFHTIKDPGPLSEDTIITIEKGTSSRHIASVLEANGIVKNRYLFLFATMINGHDNALKAGEYMFPAGMSVNAALETIVNGDVIRRQITIPEGLTSYQVIERLNALPDLTGTIDTIPPEGRLLPQTYDYQKGEPRMALVTRMRDDMNAVLQEVLPDRAPYLPLTTTEEVLTLASVIEKETAKPSERARIAGVFVNRLRKNMPLQTDPTVIYAITKGRPENNGKGPLGRRLLRKDLKYDSPYNTYLYPGLPPGPIANPGYDAIVAALNPETHNYIYFVADGTGGHMFAETLAEHNANVRQWRKIRATEQK